MKFLLNIPFFMSMAKRIWGDDPTPEFCIESLPLMNGDCWSQFIVKALGIAIILGACFSKAPLMLNIINSKSSEGLSRTACYGEAIMCANGAFYGFLEHFPFTAYGETVALTIQCLIIVHLLWKYTNSPPVSMQERVLFGGIFLLYSVCACTVLPKHLHYLLVSANWPVLVYSRGSQIAETVRVQHTGAQSIVTNGLNLVGGLIRILTTIKEVGWDIAVLTGYGLSTILNLTMVLQQLYYRSNTDKFLASLKVEAEKKKS